MGIVKSIAKKSIDIGLEGAEYGLETAGLEGAAKGVGSVKEGIDIVNTIINIGIGIIVCLFIYLIFIIWKILCKIFCGRHITSTSKRNKCRRSCGIQNKYINWLPFI